MMNHPFLLLGSILGGLGVAIGAFGAHALKSVLEANDRVGTFELAGKYHLIHAVALLCVGLLAMRAPESVWLTRAGWSFVGGITVFSGTLYALSLTGRNLLGAITPIGGVLLIAGWICLAIAAARLTETV